LLYGVFEPVDGITNLSASSCKENAKHGWLAEAAIKEAMILAITFTIFPFLPIDLFSSVIFKACYSFYTQHFSAVSLICVMLRLQ
jgi:hypothetical protein